MCTRSQRIFEAFRGDLGRGGRTSQAPEETIKAVGPETNDDILYFKYFFGGDVRAPGANGIVKRSGLRSERLANTLN